MILILVTVVGGAVVVCTMLAEMLFPLIVCCLTIVLIPFGLLLYLLIDQSEGKENG